MQRGRTRRPRSGWTRRLTLGLSGVLAAGVSFVAGPTSIASAAPSYVVVQQGSATLAGSVGSVSVVLGSAAVAGDLLVATAAVYPGTVSAGAPAGFVSAGSVVGASGHSGLASWFKVAVGGESSFRFTQPSSSSNYSQFAVTEVSGLGSSVAVDGVAAWKTSASSVSGFSLSAGSAPVGVGEFGFSFFVTSRATSQVTPSGWSLIAGPSDSNDDMGYYWQSVGGAASSITTSGLTPSGAYAAGLIVFRSTS